MKKLRYVLLEACNRRCEGCCNKDWDLASLPDETDFSQYDEILLTGGEPMLRPGAVVMVVDRIRKQNSRANIYLYTAKVDDIHAMAYVLQIIDGVTVTLHEQADVGPFLKFDKAFNKCPAYFSLRLNVFNNIEVPYAELKENWKIKDKIEWIKNCPLPANETIKKLIGKSSSSLL